MSETPTLAKVILEERESLMAENERLRNDLGQLFNIIKACFDQSEAENVRLRAALEWYANAENYDTGQDCPDILIDGGAAAKRALATDIVPKNNPLSTSCVLASPG